MSASSPTATWGTSRRASSEACAPRSSGFLPSTPSTPSSSPTAIRSSAAVERRSPASCANDSGARIRARPPAVSLHATRPSARADSRGLLPLVYPFRELLDDLGEGNTGARRRLQEIARLPRLLECVVRVPVEQRPGAQLAQLPQSEERGHRLARVD